MNNENIVKISQPELDIPLIELNSCIGIIDFHNFAEFINLIYNINNKVILEWNEYSSDSYFEIKKLSRKICLSFEEDINLSLTSIDKSFPLQENANLEYFIVESFNDSLYEFQFFFCGGQSLRVSSKYLKCYCISTLK